MTKKSDMNSKENKLSNQNDETKQTANPTKVDSEKKEAEKKSIAKKNEHPSFTDTLPQFKKYQRKKLWRRLSLIVGVLLIPLLISMYYISPFSRLASVAVSGNQTIESSKIIKDSHLQYDQDFLTQYFKRANAINAIKKENVRVKSVSIVPKSINELAIKITEYDQIAQLSKGKLYYPILENGKTLTSGTKKPTNGFVILEDFKKDQAIVQTIKAYESLPADIQSAISQINATPTKANDSLLRLMMKDGNTVIVNIENLAKQMAYYPKVAKDLPDKGIIDMEVGIFYTPYGSESTTDEENATSETNTSEQLSSSSEKTPSSSEEETPSSSETVTNPQ